MADGEGGVYDDLGFVGIGASSQQGADDSLLVGWAAGAVVEDGEEGLYNTRVLSVGPVIMALSLVFLNLPVVESRHGEEQLWVGHQRRQDREAWTGAVSHREPCWAGGAMKDW